MFSKSSNWIGAATGIYPLYSEIWAHLCGTLFQGVYRINSVLQIDVPVFLFLITILCEMALNLLACHKQSKQISTGFARFIR